MAKTVEERFWEKVDTSGGAEACWPWKAYRKNSGYGLFILAGRNMHAHRAAFTLAHGAVPEGLVVRHRCNNPPCCNPRHLCLGTQKDNIDDMLRQQRQASGEKHGMFGKGHLIAGERNGMYGKGRRGMENPNAKLTSEQVEVIKGRYAEGGITQRQLGALFGVNQSVISLILRGKAWSVK